jgi:hypothetical protein
MIVTLQLYNKMQHIVWCLSSIYTLARFFYLWNSWSPGCVIILLYLLYRCAARQGGILFVIYLGQIILFVDELKPHMLDSLRNGRPAGEVLLARERIFGCNLLKLLWRWFCIFVTLHSILGFYSDCTTFQNMIKYTVYCFLKCPAKHTNFYGSLL